MVEHDVKDIAQAPEGQMSTVRPRPHRTRAARAALAGAALALFPVVPAPATPPGQ